MNAPTYYHSEGEWDTHFLRLHGCFMFLKHENQTFSMILIHMLSWATFYCFKKKGRFYRYHFYIWSQQIFLNL